MTTRALGWIALAGFVGIGATACDETNTALEPGATLLSVAPAGGASGVALDQPVVVTFDHPMHTGAMDVAAVHEGDVTGPTVPGTWTMAEDGTEMRFAPQAPWQPATRYTIHLGGGMQDDEGHMVDFESHGPAMGGAWAGSGMMGGGMMGGGSHPHMSGSWEHANGSYGMIFSFTTAG